MKHFLLKLEINIMSNDPTSEQSVLTFDGIDDRVELAKGFPSIDKAVTVEFWAKGDNSVTESTSVMEASNVANERVLNIHLPWGDSRIYWDAGNENGSYDRIDKGVTLEEYNSWTHWAFVKDTVTGKMLIYRNGEIWHQGEGNTRSLAGINNLVIGSFYGNNCYWKGSLTEFRIWNTARTQAEIKQNMNSRLRVNEAGLVGYYPFNGDGNDQTINANNGTIHGATWQQASIPLVTKKTINKNAKQIEECEAIIKELRTYKERFWAIGVNGTTLQPDGFLTFFAARKLPFKFFVRGAVSLGEESAYDENIATLEKYIQTLQNDVEIEPITFGKPNILIFITDQESAAVKERWPQSFEDEHLPATKRLKKNGLTFNKMFTVTSACSPSRATLLTSTYPNEHGVVNTVSVPYCIISRYKEYGQAYAQYFLRPTQTNLAHVLQAAGYKVHWKGKWHLSHPMDGTDQWTLADIEYMKRNYGFDSWTPYEGGVAREDATKFGKGTFYNDERCLKGLEAVKQIIKQESAEERHAFKGLPPEKRQEKEQELIKEIEGKIPKQESILEFVNKYKPEDGPFCLIVSLVNPHDIHVAPNFDPDAGYSVEDFENFNLPIPKNANEDLSFKPEVQEVFRQGCLVTDQGKLKNIRQKLKTEKLGRKGWLDQIGINEGQPFLEQEKVQQQYVNFYGYLNKLVDNQINEVLEAFEAKGLINNTLIVKTSDHGEMCLAHGGQREKAFNAYEETIRVPLIISNPHLFPNPVETDTLACSLDLMPTLAKFAGVYDIFKYSFQGSDLTPLFTKPQGEVLDPEGKVRDCIHFTYDDGVIPGRFELTPRRIRTLRTNKWKYSVYFNDNGSNYEFELYDLENDPDENNNLSGHPEYLPKFRELHQQLQDFMYKLKTIPHTFSLYTDEMRAKNFLPSLYWPTREEAEYEAVIDYGANIAQAGYRQQQHAAIQARAQDVHPDMWWIGT